MRSLLLPAKKTVSSVVRNRQSNTCHKISKKCSHAFNLLSERSIAQWA
jgi:hypothetical protein